MDSRRPHRHLCQERRHIHHGQRPADLRGGAGGLRGDFCGRTLPSAAGASGYTLYAYYPYSEQVSDDASDIAFTLAPQQTQTAAGDSSHLGDTDFLVAGAVQSPTGDFGTLAFRHAFAVVEVDLTASGEMAGKRLSEVTLYCTDAATVDAAGNLGEMSNLTGAFTFDLTAASATTRRRMRAARRRSITARSGSRSPRCWEAMR